MLEGKQDLLAERLMAGDREAAAELVDKYYEQICLFMRRLGNDREHSEDMTQETFLNAWQHLGQLRSGSALTSWLYHIAANVAKSRWRRDDHEPMELADGLAARRPEVEEVERNDDLQRLATAVQGLPVKLKQAVILHYMQHLTIAEGAEAAGVRQGTFKRRINIALKKLRKRLDRSRDLKDERR